MGWSGGLIEWEEGNTVKISVVFSWQIQKAYSKAIWHKTQGKNVIVGGPATIFNGEMFSNIAEVGRISQDAIYKHNTNATFTSRGCVRKCQFCIVSKLEGNIIELDEWPLRPIICDNNILATSKTHFNNVIDKIKPLIDIDFNQGLDARLLTKHHAERLRELNTKIIRLAWDNIKIEKKFMKAWEYLRGAGIPKSHIQSYVLVGYDDTPEDALYRCETIKKMGGLPTVMRYQPLQIQNRNGFLSPNWGEDQIKRFARYWNRQRFLSPVPFSEYDHTFKKQPKDQMDLI